MPKKRAIKYPRTNRIKDRIIPPSEEMSATFLSFFKSISKPTINNKNAMPISDNVLITSELVIKPRTGPMSNPVIIYAGIIGCLSSLTKIVITVATMIIIPMLKNISLTIIC